MNLKTRDKMVLGAVDLLRRRGVNATSVREIVRHSETPRGSVAFHFPHGKKQIIEEALALADREVSPPLQALVTQQGAIAGLKAFIGLWRKILESTHYDAGCPVLAVAVEQYVGEDGSQAPEIQQALLNQVNAIFEKWQTILSRALQDEGVAADRAVRLARLVVSAIEGTVALCRAARSSQPLTDVGAELEQVLNSALPAPTRMPD